MNSEHERKTLPSWVITNWGNVGFWDALVNDELPNVCYADIGKFIKPGKDLDQVVRLTRADFTDFATDMFANFAGKVRWDWCGAWPIETYEEFAHLKPDVEVEDGEFYLIASFEDERDAFLFKLACQ